MMANSLDLDFLQRFFEISSAFKCGSESFWWRTDGEYAPVTLLINCNDLFYWATSDCEHLTPDNIHILEQAFEDCKAADPKFGYIYSESLFCCRVRKMRPQIPYYKSIPEELHELFNACGPERTAKECG